MSKKDASELISEAVEKQLKTKKKGCFKMLCQIIGVLFVLLLIWYLTVGRGVALKISPETTWITEPRTPDGKWIDYSKAYEQMCYPPEMQTDENGYRIITRHLGLPEISQTYTNWQTGEVEEYDFDVNKMRVQGYEKLGLDPNVPPDMKMTFYERLIMDYVKEMHLEDTDAENKLWGELYSVKNEPWTLEEYPMLAPWVEQNFPVLDMVSEAVDKPVFGVPIVLPEGHDSLSDMFTFSTEAYSQFRSYAREFQSRFQYRLGQGDIDGAMKDKIATHRLARHAGHQGTLISYLVGIAIDGMAYDEGIANNLDVEPTPDQIRHLMRLQAELRPSITTQQAMESERLFILDGLQNDAKGTSPPITQDFLQPKIMKIMRPFLSTIDWNIVFRRANQYFDGELTAEEPKITLGYVASYFYSRDRRSENYIDAQAAWFMPSLDTMEEAKRRHDCFGNLQQITLAMLLYHAEQGMLPPAFSVDENGKPLQSWRVLLLPYLGDESLTELYSQIRLDEPWDSEHNRQFHEKTLKVYRCPSCEAAGGMKPGEASYCVIVGDETPFGNDGIGKKLSDFGPQSAGMPLVTERRTPSNWMDPNWDVTFEQAKEGINGLEIENRTLGSHHIGGANFGLRNGAVNFFYKTVEPEKWEKVLQGKEKIR